VRLLVGYDGRDGGDDGLELARVIASEAEGSAVVATVLFSGSLFGQLRELVEAEAEEAEPSFEKARAKLGDMLDETRAFAGGSPGETLTKLAEAEEIDAIVLGSPHRGAIGRVLIGSVGRNVLNGAPCDVIVAPRGYAAEERNPFRTIAVGYDGTAEADRALRQAEEVALLSNATIRIITVVSPPVMIPGAVGYTPAMTPPDPEKLLLEAVESVDHRLGVERRRLDGSPGDSLVRECEEGVDLLMLGSRGYGPLARVLLGSVSRHVAQHAPCPVWVVPRP
jgi:nucleotide-binding universal stress UspA family protein